MKKKIIRRLLTAAAALCIFCAGMGAGAAGTAQQITATLDSGVTVTLDGIPQQFFNAAGTRVYPILYNGTTYLPLRPLGETLGLTVDWDQPTRTASLLTVPMEGVDLIEEYEEYDWTENWVHHIKSSNKKTKDVSGFTLNRWIELFADRRYGAVHTSFNLMAKYDTLTFKYYATKDATLQVLGDNDSVLYEVQVTGGKVAQEATVNLMKTNQLTFQFTTEDYDMYAYVFDTRLK